MIDTKLNYIIEHFLTRFKVWHYINFCTFMVLKISEKISGRMTKVATALVDLKSAVETDQLSSTVVPQECCMDGVYQENARLRTNVTS